VPKGTLGGADEAVMKKDKFYGKLFKFNDYKAKAAVVIALSATVVALLVGGIINRPVLRP